MPRLCGACTHPLRSQIDADLLAHAESYRGIGRRYGLEDDALRRHEHEHLRMSWQLSKELAAMLSADNLRDKLAELDSETRALLTEARTAGDLRVALAAVRESRENIAAFARLGILTDVEKRLDALEHPTEGDDGQPD